MSYDCQACDEHGPDERYYADTFIAGATAFHRAMHGLWREIEATLLPIVEWMGRSLDRRS